MLFFVFISADVSGSLEAIVNILSRYHSPDITLNLLHAGVGPVTENDLKMLQSSQGFNMLYVIVAFLNYTITNNCQQFQSMYNFTKQTLPIIVIWTSTHSTQ